MLLYIISLNKASAFLKKRIFLRKAIPGCGFRLGHIVIPRVIRRTMRIREKSLTENFDTGFGILYGCGIGEGTVHREVNR